MANIFNTVRGKENQQKTGSYSLTVTMDGSIVFYAYPASSTANSKYSRSELREQKEKAVYKDKDMERWGVFKY